MLNITDFEMGTDDEEYASPTTRTPYYQESCTMTGDRTTLTVLVDRKYDDQGSFAGEAYYLVPPKFAQEHELSVRVCDFYGFYSTDLGHGLLPVKRDAQGRPNFWNISLRNIAETQDGFFSLRRDKENSRYFAVPLAPSEFELDGAYNYEPMPFQELLERAFEGRIIDTPDHPVLKALIK